MKMKKLSVAIMSASLMAHYSPNLRADEDWKVTVEAGWRIGGKKKPKFSELDFNAVRLQSDDTEFHVFRARDPEDDVKFIFGAGLGQVYSTEDEGTYGDDRFSMSGTVGVAWTTEATADRPLPLHAFGRVAWNYGNPGGNWDIQGALASYWRLIDPIRTHDSFGSVGIQYKDLVNNEPKPVTTAPPTTAAPTTAAPTTAAPTTAAPTTAAPTTAAPTTAAPTTAAPTTAAPTTAPVTTAPVTTAPVTTAPVTTAPVTTAPVTTAPVTTAPVTTAPVTTAPVTTAPVTTAPVTTAPVTTAPVTTAPVTTAPVTTAPVTVDPGLCVPNTWKDYPTAEYPDTPADGFHDANECKEYFGIQ